MGAIGNRASRAERQCRRPFRARLEAHYGHRLLRSARIIPRGLPYRQHLPGGQAVGIKEVDDGICLVSFMDYDLGYIDLEEKTLQPLNNPFGPKVLPMS